MGKVVVADTGPIIAFARPDLLALLPTVFERVYVTDAVVAECLAGRDTDEIARIRAAVDDGFERIAAPDYEQLLFNIDAGEASAIAAAVESGYGVLMDDKTGRKVAGNLGVSVIGTVGTLIISKRRRFVSAIRPLVDDLLTSGYYLGADVIAMALAACDEYTRGD